MQLRRVPLGLAFLLVLVSACSVAAIPHSLVDGTAAESGGTPTMGTCGSNPGVSGDDRSGVITVGSGVVTACTLNFSATLGYTPNCIAVPNSVLAVGVTAISTSAVTFTVLSTIGGGKLYYVCLRGA